MSNFAIAKIAFVIALLGTMFAVHPIIDDYAQAQIVSLFGTSLDVIQGYFAFVILLGVAVYCYAAAFTAPSAMQTVLQRLGNGAYVLALLVPLFCIILLGSGALGTLLVGLFGSEDARPIVSTLAALIGLILGAVVGRQATNILNTGDRESLAQRLTSEEASSVSRAAEMLRAGHYDLAVIDAFKAIESVLRRALLRRDIRVRSNRTYDVIKAAVENKVVPREMLGDINKVREARNKAAHEEGQIDKATAEDAVEKARQILGSVQEDPEEQPLDTFVVDL